MFRARSSKFKVLSISSLSHARLYNPVYLYIRSSKVHYVDPFESYDPLYEKVVILPPFFIYTALVYSYTSALVAYF